MIANVREIVYFPDMAIAATIGPGEVGFDQTEFNVARWEELLGDLELARIENRIETDRFGQIIMSPLPSPAHGRFQSAITRLLGDSLPKGEVITECPVSTSGGVKGCDVAWISRERFAPMAEAVCLTIAPEICVEVLSPSNSKGEIDEKVRLFFEAGAEEVWLCDRAGRMTFHLGSLGQTRGQSIRCPGFPSRIELAA